MAYEKKEGDISVFLNDKRTDENKQPNYTGTALYNGETLSISLWLKYPDGKPAFLTGSIKKHVPKDGGTGVDPIQQPPVFNHQQDNAPGPLEEGDQQPLPF